MPNKESQIIAMMDAIGKISGKICELSHLLQHVMGTDAESIVDIGGFPARRPHRKGVLIPSWRKAYRTT